jgi:ADP-heptose:LPS heptosyltransferase
LEKIHISPSAGDSSRQWSPLAFAKITDFLFNKWEKEFLIIIVGSNADRAIGKQLIDELHPTTKVINIMGDTTLKDLLHLVNLSSLVFANESGIIHMAASLKKKAICISNGNHFKRFHPYPPSMNLPIQYFYPPFIREHWNDQDFLIKRYSEGSSLNIHSIKPEWVLKQLEDLHLD